MEAHDDEQLHPYEEFARLRELDDLRHYDEPPSPHGPYTIGSLFDGSGGFPLAAQQNGMEALWASEVNEFRVSVTKRHFPHMRHLGDVTKVRGDQVDPVDVITFGSPCQDLSIAGTLHGRKGLDGQRSSLFYEAVRIIDEMREATDGRYPRFGAWENVPGALSSNKGDDFRCVVEALARVVDKDATIPLPRTKRWTTSGMVAGNGWSIAWRVLDAQYFGVAQRRRRIVLVADFGGDCAGGILFEHQGSGGIPSPRRNAWNRSSPRHPGSDADSGHVTNDETFVIQGNALERYGGLGAGGKGFARGISYTLTKQDRHVVIVNGKPRRLTPRECERLQGFSDDWTAYGIDENGKVVKGSDSKRYQAMGDSIAIPVFSWLFKRIKRELEKERHHVCGGRD